MPRSLTLVPVGAVEARVLARLAEALASALPVRAVVAGDALADRWPPGPVPSAGMVDALIAADLSGWRLAVTERPLTGADGARVAGEATVAGPAAILSLHALRDGDAARFAHRVAVCAVHEVGHLCGLDHCAEPSCALHPSGAAGDADRRAPRLCGRCAAAARDVFAHGA